MIYLLILLSVCYYIAIMIEMKNGTLKCHKKASRSPKIIKNKQWRICTRCLSMYFTMGLFPLYYIILRIINIQISLNNILLIFIICIILQLPMLVDGITQKTKKRISNNYLRFITGSLSGIGLGIIIAEFSLILKEVI